MARSPASRRSTTASTSRRSSRTTSSPSSIPRRGSEVGAQRRSPAPWTCRRPPPATTSWRRRRRRRRGRRGGLARLDPGRRGVVVRGPARGHRAGGRSSIAPAPEGETRAKLQAAIDDGTLRGSSRSSPLPSWRWPDRTASRCSTAGGARRDGAARRRRGGLALVSSVEDSTQLYVTTGRRDGQPQVVVVAVPGRPPRAGPDVTDTIQMPGPGTRVLFDASAEMVEVLGTTPDGAGTTVYVVEPHGESRVRRPASPVRPDRARARPQRGLPDGQPRPDPGLRRGWRDRVARHRPLRVRVAPAGRR